MDRTAFSRRVAWTIVAALLVVLAFQLVVGILLTPFAPVWIGHDFIVYRDAAAEWLAGGSFYESYQIDGGYFVWDSEILYPPVSLVLFAPFTMLPAFLWWAMPLGITLWVIVSHRPGPWTLAAMIGLLCLPISYGTSHSLSSIVGGNPAIWVMAFVALATRFPAFGPLVLFKFTLLPFAAVGITRKAWWVGLALLVAACIPFGAMWFEYLTVLENALGAGPFYSFGQFPMMLVPVVAWWGRSRTPWATA